MTTNLETTIQSIASRATSELATEIVRAVRRVIAAEIAGGNGFAAAAPVKRGPGRPRKEAAALPAPTTKGKRRKPRKLARVTEGDLSRLLKVVAKKPGMTSVQIQRAAGIDSTQAARVLLKLRKAGRVKWKGERSAATYSVA
jgi:hypothetical protein